MKTSMVEPSQRNLCNEHLATVLFCLGMSSGPMCISKRMYASSHVVSTSFCEALAAAFVVV